MSQLDVLGPGFGMPSTAFDAFVGSGNKCRKVDVILAGVVAPRASNREIADKLFCSESRLRSGESISNQGLVYLFGLLTGLRSQ